MERGVRLQRVRAAAVLLTLPTHTPCVCRSVRCVDALWAPCGFAHGVELYAAHSSLVHDVRVYVCGCRGLTLAIAGGTAGEEDQLSCVPWPAGRTDDARLSQHSSPRFCPAQPRTLDLTRNAFAMMRVLLALSFICRMPPLCFRVFKNPDMAALNTRLVLSVLHRRSPPRQSPSKRLSSPPTANTPLRSRPLLPSPFSLSLRWR
eukprot:3937746-Rhodomonas_salina.1